MIREVVVTRAELAGDRAWTVSGQHGTPAYRASTLMFWSFRVEPNATPGILQRAARIRRAFPEDTRTCCRKCGANEDRHWESDGMEERCDRLWR